MEVQNKPAAMARVPDPAAIRKTASAWRNGYKGPMKSPCKYVIAALVATFLPSAGPLARESCPVEAKLLLSTQARPKAIASLGLTQETTGRIYLFDTDALDLSKQQVILRVRQGANNDLVVKVRKADGDRPSEASTFKGISCEIDQTRTGAQTSYSVGRDYTAAQVPQTGNDIRKLLSAAQRELLRKTGVSVEWDRVRRVASIESSSWRSSARSQFGKLALELWEWPQGEILELSAKAGAEAGSAAYADLERLAQTKGLALSPSQDTKTSTVLQTHPGSP